MRCDASQAGQCSRTGIDVERGEEHGEQAAERRVVEQAALRVERRERERALAEMREALRQAHHEQCARLLRVVHCQLPQHRRQTRVVRTRAHQTHREDRVARHLLIASLRASANTLYKVYTVLAYS